MEVANVVASIISAFGNGMDLFRRMTGKKPKRRGREPTLSEEEAWLRDSLDRRPREIRESYNKSVTTHGHRFEIGDSIAHTSLAHTLLVLNSGLINLINQALSTDSKKNNLSRRSLLNLSEVAAADTLNALSQLSLRLSSRSQMSLPAPTPSAPTREAKTRDRKAKPKQEGPSTKRRPGPTPLLVRGGWVRPKSGSTVSSSSSKSATSGAKHLRSKSESSVPRAAKVPPLEARQSITAQGGPGRRQSSPETRQTQRQPSMLIAPSDIFLPLSEEPQSYQTAPPRPPKIPLHSRPNPALRPRPPSQATFMTTSTKIGEIPEGRQGQPRPTVVDQIQDPRLVQYLVPPTDHHEEDEPRRRGRGFKFWKRSEKAPPIAAH